MWIVSAQFEYTIADNCIDTETKQWVYEVRPCRQREYLESRDTREDVIRYFAMNEYPNLPQVKYEEYEKFRAQYSQIANSNPPRKKH